MTTFIVEGSGDEHSIPILLEKTKGRSVPIHCVDMQGKSNILRVSDGFEKTVLRQVEQGFRKFVLLLDRDVTFAPYTTLAQETNGMNERVARLAQDDRIEVSVFWAIREFESWLVGGLKKGDEYCGLKKIPKVVSGDTQSSPNDPKEWIKSRTNNNRYNENTQVCLSRHVDWSLARKRNESLRLFVDSILH